MRIIVKVTSYLYDGNESGENYSATSYTTHVAPSVNEALVYALRQIQAQPGYIRVFEEGGDFLISYLRYRGGNIEVK